MGLLIVVAGMAGSAVAGVWLDATHSFKYVRMTKKCLFRRC